MFIVFLISHIGSFVDPSVLLDLPCPWALKKRKTLLLKKRTMSNDFLRSFLYISNWPIVVKNFHQNFVLSVPIAHQFNASKYQSWMSYLSPMLYHSQPYYLKSFHCIHCWSNRPPFHRALFHLSVHSNRFIYQLLQSMLQLAQLNGTKRRSNNHKFSIHIDLLTPTNR